MQSTVWSINDGLSGNLRKPSETCRKPLRPVYITKNLPETCRRRGFRTIRHWQTTRYIDVAQPLWLSDCPT